MQLDDNQLRDFMKVLSDIKGRPLRIRLFQGIGLYAGFYDVKSGLVEWHVNNCDAVPIESFYQLAHELGHFWDDELHEIDEKYHGICCADPCKNIYSRGANEFYIAIEDFAWQLAPAFIDVLLDNVPDSFEEVYQNYMTAGVCRNIIGRGNANIRLPRNGLTYRGIRFTNYMNRLAELPSVGWDVAQMQEEIRAVAGI